LDEGLVYRRIPTDPRQFAVVGGEKRSGPKQQDSGHCGQAPYPEEYFTFECPAFGG
jgi:hypothetical protein